MINCNCCSQIKLLLIFQACECPLWPFEENVRGPKTSPSRILYCCHILKMHPIKKTVACSCTESQLSHCFLSPITFPYMFPMPQLYLIIILRLLPLERQSWGFSLVTHLDCLVNKLLLYYGNLGVSVFGFLLVGWTN